ncbi:MAG TPA: NYN domain-containing protein [Gemmataceae bacterium]|nr:NYN domain-containing protein [Gemmataceae bacterium]
MPFLIDGYNLLFALGFTSRHWGPHALEKSREDLLVWLEAALEDQAPSVTIVFDGREEHRNRSASPRPSGVEVRFTAGQLADDAIEGLIRQTTNPRGLTVVSSDHRIQAAARRRGCAAWDSADFIDWVLERGAPAPPKPISSAQKPESTSAEDTAHWLREFGEIEEDRELKKFNRPFEEFGED